jgi:uncharacterized OB-fold protein
MDAKHMDASGKPLPEITDATRPFWTAAKNRKLVVQKCGRCGTLNFFPKPWCIDCGSRGLEWVEVSGKGTVYSFTTANKVMMNFPGWKAELPVTLGIIDLDEGARMYGQLVGAKPAAMKIGMKVKAVFEDISPEAGIPKFVPA